MCNKNNKLEITLESLRVFEVLNDCTDNIMFRRVNGEGLACDQMFCICAVWVDRSSAVLTSTIKSWHGKVSDQFLNGCTLQKRICYLTIVFLTKIATVDMVLWDDSRSPL